MLVQYVQFLLIPATNPYRKAFKMSDYPDFLYRIKQAFPFTGYPLHKRENYRPFFIVGSGRSGNTLLRRILGTHPGVHIPPETYVLGPSIQLFARYNNMKWPSLVRLILSQFEYYPEFGTFDITLRPLVNHLDKLPESKRSLAYLLDNFYRYHAEVQAIDCIRWGDKTPMNTFWLGRIFSVFPDAKFINMIRDGVDVIASYLQAGIYRNLEEAALRWHHSLRLASQFNKNHPGIMLDVYYEDLVTTPESTVQNICRFLDIEYQPGMLEVKNSQVEKMGDIGVYDHLKNVRNSINPDSIGKGRQQLSDEEKKRLEKLIGNIMKQYGYLPCTAR